MLAGNVRVDILGCHAGLARNQVAQTGGVEHRARTEDLVAGQSRELERHVGDDVNGVRDEHEAGVRGHVLQVRLDLFIRLTVEPASSRRDCPGCCFAPAVTMIRSEPRTISTSSEPSIEPAGVN
mgnify:CR=1 FL=1